LVHQFSGLTGLAVDLSELEITAVATVSLTLGVVLGGLAAVFSLHAARGVLMAHDVYQRLSRPVKTRPGRHRLGRVPVGTH
jgi:hypothetical protein